MIKTEFIKDFDYSAHIPEGSKIGLIGCSKCAALFKTADTQTMEKVRDFLALSWEVVFTLSIDSPCDQRVFKQISRSVPRFDLPDVYVVLACEAGARSIGGYVKKAVCPLKTLGYTMISSDNVHHLPCLCCKECLFPDKSMLCPVTVCPLNRTDGPCQNRINDKCIADNLKRCAWLI
jgi:hypothetical protein